MPRDPVPAPLLERFAQHEAQGASQARIEALPDAEARVAELKRSDAELLARFPPEQMVARIHAKLRIANAADGARQEPSHTPWFALAGGLAAAAAAVLIFVRLPTAPVDDGLRTKGGDAKLFVHRQSGVRSERLAELGDVRAGDVLQLSYSAGGRRHGVILSHDGNGEVTLHFPETDDAPTTLADGEVKLPFAYRLDDAPGFERFVFLTSDAPLSVPELLEAARRAAQQRDPRAPLALPPDVEQHALTLRKRDP